MVLEKKAFWKRVISSPVKGIEFIRSSLKTIFSNNEPFPRRAFSIALGVGVGLSPLWGLHSFIVLGLAHFLKLNRTIALLSSFIGLPPMTPLVIFGSLKIGAWVTGTTVCFTGQPLEVLAKTSLLQFSVGGALLAVFGGLVLLMVLFLFEKLFRKTKSETYSVRWNRDVSFTEATFKKVIATSFQHHNNQYGVWTSSSVQSTQPVCSSRHFCPERLSWYS